MRTKQWLPLAAILMCAVAAQAWDGAGFRGTWTAELNGKTYCRLMLSDGNPVSGTLALGDLRTDGDGELESVGDAPNEGLVIKNAAIENGELRFEVLDGDDTTKFAVRMTDDTTMKMRALGVPPDQKLNPWILKRQ